MTKVHHHSLPPLVPVPVYVAEYQGEAVHIGTGNVGTSSSDAVHIDFVTVDNDAEAGLGLRSVTDIF